MTGAGLARHAAVFLLAFVPASVALAQGFGVSPIRLDLDRATRSASITVNNDDDKPLGFQVRPKEWVQDAEGKDQYLDTKDLIVFPLQFQVPPGQSRIFRVGYRAPAAKNEQAYRVFIEDLPAPAPVGDGEHSSVVISVQFGVPVFLRPPVIRQSAELQQFGISKGNLTGVLLNTGTVHVRPASVRVEGLGDGGQKVFEHVFDGWYVLSGGSHRYSAPLAPEACRQARKLAVEATGDKLALKSVFEVAAGSCTP